MINRFLSLYKSIPPYVLVVLFAISTLLSVYALRNNNLTMVKLRDAVYEADRKDGDVNAALNDLRRYVHSHMNTNLSSGGNTIKPPIQLKYTYERLAEKSAAAVNDKGLYTEAANYCQDKIPASVSISGSGRIACVQDYILSHGGKLAPAIPTSLYQFDFISPIWSPDLAGWSLVLSAAILIALVASFLLARAKSMD